MTEYIINSHFKNLSLFERNPRVLDKLIFQIKLCKGFFLFEEFQRVVRDSAEKAKRIIGLIDNIYSKIGEGSL